MAPVGGACGGISLTWGTTGIMFQVWRLKLDFRDRGFLRHPNTLYFCREGTARARRGAFWYPYAIFDEWGREGALRPILRPAYFAGCGTFTPT